MFAVWHFCGSQIGVYPLFLLKFIPKILKKVTASLSSNRHKETWKADKVYTIYHLLKTNLSSLTNKPILFLIDQKNTSLQLIKL